MKNFCLIFKERVHPMSRVGLIGENSIEYIDHLLDIWNEGKCAVLIDWRIPPRTAVKMLEDADVNICYVEEKQYNRFRKLLLQNIKFVYRI